jgi:DNA polymerase-3 subunit epsilon/ATP-dependent DNA helicase DinG
LPYVALDLETTGLEPDRDEIIEVAAIRFDAGGVIDRFHSLVNPGRALEYRIALLTGIDQAELRAAPHFSSIAREVEEFIGLDPIVGQNPGFDTAFLERNGVQIFAPSFDTFDLASLLLPSLRERSLGAIADHLGIPFETRHRAMADADAAREVFVELRARLGASPPELLAEAERLAAASDWPLRHLLQEVAAEAHRSTAERAYGLVHSFVKAPPPAPEPLHPTSRLTVVAPSEPESLLASAATRSAFAAYEERPEQTQMARTVAEVLAEGGELIVEAGTGVGKSLAYLLPSALHAVRNSARTVISTNTINLQDQLLAQDIPIARRLLAAAGIDASDMSVTQLKGRANYVCLLRWTSARHAASLTSGEARVLVRVLFWLAATDTGDRAELGLRYEDDQAWSRINAADAGCMTMQCQYVRDGSCFLLRARRRADAAHLLIVNHSLLLSDIAAGGNVLPQYRHVVIDEAHHLEEEATRQLGFTASETNLLDWLDALHARGRERDAGLVGSVLSAARGAHQAIGAAPQLQSLARTLAESVRRVRPHLPTFFEQIRVFAREHAGARGDYDDRMPINRALRVQPDWGDIETAWFSCEEQLAQVSGIVDELVAMLAQMNPSDILDRDGILADATQVYADGERLRHGISRIIEKDDRNTICWITIGRYDAAPALSSAPLSVAESLRAGLFNGINSAVLTSATLSIDGQFGYIRDRLGLPDARELQLGSPFDYRSSTLMLTVTDMPEPDQVGYADAVQAALIDLVSATEGRALALFTSHAALRTAYNGIKGALEEQGILVLAQGIDGTPRQMLGVLRENNRCVLLGAASFWEGVDVVGEALSLLVIARLPFPVPSDPVFQARSELFEQPFDQFALPQAVLRMKQGAGRLIRSKTDRGVLVVFDRRLRSRAYGETFLRSLPDGTLRDVYSRDLAAEAGAWLAPSERT